MVSVAVRLLLSGNNISFTVLFSVDLTCILFGIKTDFSLLKLQKGRDVGNEPRQKEFFDKRSQLDIRLV